MATEILGFLIIVGILIVFIVRRDLWNGSSNKADEVEEASVKMRLQMEHTMNTLITQMDSRIHQIEGLVSAADERARALEQQLEAVRAEQANTQRRAEQEFAAMRAERAMYYAPPEEPRPYEDVSNPPQVWDDYRRARAAAQDRSLRPIEGVSAVHRATYAVPVRQSRRVEQETFADTLSASMHTAGMPYEEAMPRQRATRAAYYAPAQSVGYRERPAASRYEERSYPEAYAPEPYPVDSYAEEPDWERYATPEPSRPVFRSSGRNVAPRQVQEIPVEMAVEETPAVIVSSSLTPRREVYEREDEAEEERGFSQEQLEELANTEAEIVVSSSVADVVDLPLDSDEAEEAEYEDEADEDVHAFAEPEEDHMTVPEEELFDEAEEAEEDPLPETGSAPVLSPKPEELRAADEADAMETDTEPEAETEESEETLLRSDWPEGIMEEEEPGESDLPEETGATEDENAVAAEPQAIEAMEEGEQDEILFDEIRVKIEEIEADETPAREELPIQQDDSIRPPSPAIRARELLASGKSVDEVVRETGMGRSAVDLLAQMAGNKEKTESDD